VEIEDIGRSSYYFFIEIRCDLFHLHVLKVFLYAMQRIVWVCEMLQSLKKELQAFIIVTCS
jgi:hypothetical protein